ncbi:MAG: alpha/beta hydrolase [Clostridiaceae bacterium]|nr:alpha/beta hydrolase [Clostridiaceae bacterium]
MKRFLGFVLVVTMCLGGTTFVLAEDASYTEYKVTLQGDSYEIPATVCAPTAEGSYPAVVMLHGTGSNREEAGNGYAYAAPVMAAEYGVATIRIDFPGNGESTADYMLYTFDSAVADAATAAAYMAGLDNIDADRIGVMGWSQGGTDALLAAGKHPEVFKSVVTWAGAPDLTSMCTEEAYAEAKANGFFVMEFEWRDSLNVSLQWCEDVMNTDVLAVFSNFEGPILAISGTADTTVDPEWSNKIVATSNNAGSKAYFIENMDHTFNVFSGDLTALHDAINATGAFFAETLAE